MGKAKLFDKKGQENYQSVIEQINKLMERYCQGIIENLRPLPDNTLDIRINNGSEEKSYSFDGLSSGQKEIIATLFLIWKNSRNQPCIVLIDEPELHLNSEWHSDFIEQLKQLAPRNQYILATHSEDIFRSVDQSRRMLLQSGNEEASA